MEVPRRPTQSQMDCSPEMEQAEGFQTPLGTSSQLDRHKGASNGFKPRAITPLIPPPNQGMFGLVTATTYPAADHTQKWGVEQDCSTQAG